MIWKKIKILKYFVSSNVFILLNYNQGFPTGPWQKHNTFEWVILNTGKHSLLGNKHLLGGNCKLGASNWIRT